MSKTCHSVRNSLIDRETRYCLDEESLTATSDRRELAVPYASIRRIGLIDYAGFGARHRQATVRTAENGTLKIRSHHYAGLSNFDDRSATYEPFVRELSRRVATGNAECAFVSGSSAMQVFGIAMLVILAGAVLALVLALFGGTEDMDVLVGIGIAVALVPVVWRFARRGKATFDPLNPPLDIER